MLNDNAKKWVAALRSGEFSQTQAVLRDLRGYCCLGVLCEIFRRETGRGEWDARYFFVEDEGKRYESHTDLVRQVAQWVGLETVTAAYGDMESLIRHNDTGDNFSKIADIIELEPEGLFVK